MTRVLVTGAQGFTARYLIPVLQASGHEVHGLFRPDLPDSEGMEQVAVHKGDLRDPSAIGRIVRDARPEAVIHLAAISNVAHLDVREMYEANLIGSRNLLEALVASNSPIASVLLASSANVYGNRHEGRLDESAPVQPINDYGITKLAMEYVGKMYSQQLPIVIVRPFNYTGVGQSSDFIIPKIVAHARRRAPFIELGNLDVERDFSDVRYVVDCYARLVQSTAAVGQTFNICSGRPHSLFRVMKIVEGLTGHRMEVRKNESFVRRSDAKSLYGDNRRLIDNIGSVPSPSLEATLQWMVEG